MPGFLPAAILCLRSAGQSVPARLVGACSVRASPDPKSPLSNCLPNTAISKKYHASQRHDRGTGRHGRGSCIWGLSLSCTKTVSGKLDKPESDIDGALCAPAPSDVCRRPPPFYRHSHPRKPRTSSAMSSYLLLRCLKERWRFTTATTPPPFPAIFRYPDAEMR